MQIAGVYTALVTPFTSTGEVDYELLAALVEKQVTAGIAGVVPCGTTGESPTLSKEEKQKVIKETIRVANGRLQVIAGTGSNNTADAVYMTKWAKEAGADACLIVNPYYNKPSQAGLIAHVKAIEAVGLPIMLYNIPGRSGVNMTPQTVVELSRLPGVVAIKEASGSLDQASEIASLCDLTILSGDDSLTLPLMCLGAKGVVSVLSNLIPAEVVGMVNKARKGDYDGARKDHLRLFPLFKNMFIETNPVPVKRAMELAGFGPTLSEVRLPLVKLTPESEAKLQAVLKAANLA